MGRVTMKTLSKRDSRPHPHYKQQVKDSISISFERDTSAFEEGYNGQTKKKKAE